MRRLDRARVNCKIAPLNAGIAQLVEHNLAKVGVASSNLVSRSKSSIVRAPVTTGVFAIRLPDIDTPG